jgi:hypothetical protein
MRVGAEVNWFTLDLGAISEALRAFGLELDATRPEGESAPICTASRQSEVVHIETKATMSHSCASSIRVGRGSMSDPEDLQTCEFCKIGRVIKSDQTISFRQWTDKGYVNCHANIPIGVCDHCGSKNWDDDAEAIIEEAVRQEYQKLA